MTMIKRFTIGFTLGLLLFLLVNLASAHLASDCGLMAVFGRDSCADDIARAGWPLRFYEEGGLEYHKSFQSGLLLIDLVVGLALATAIGWLATRRVK